jgi:Flp pilus assembly pilin Flp
MSKRRKRGQMVVEYAVMFAVIVAVIVYASTAYIKPAINRFFEASTAVINQATDRISNNF